MSDEATTVEGENTPEITEAPVTDLPIPEGNESDLDEDEDEDEDE